MAARRTGSPGSGQSKGTRPRPTGELGRYLLTTPDRGSTADAATDALREAILDGLIPASTWLREEEIAAELQLAEGRPRTSSCRRRNHPRSGV
jgi:hypothetical protein